MSVDAYPRFKSTEVYEEISKMEKPILVLRGSTSSTKTYSALQHIAGWLFTGWIRGDKVPKGVATILRKFSATLDVSVLEDFKNIIHETEMWGTDGRQYGYLVDYLKENKSKKTFYFDRRKVRFRGADDFNKAKGGRQEILFSNEADAIKFKVWEQFNARTSVLSIVDLNPDDEESWINQELEIKRAGIEGDVDVIVSTYKQNPFLLEKVKREIEYWKEADPMMYQVYGLGQYGKIQGLIFDYKDIANVPKEAVLLCYGMDFGFSNDPAACVGIWRYNDAIIFDEIFYDTGMFNSDIDKALRNEGVGKRDEIFGDSADPKSIAELYNYGWNIAGATKGPDSIRFGISVMKQQKILVTARSVNMKRELKKYKWAENRSGEQTKKPIDKFNHLIDSARYGCMEKIPAKKRKGKKIHISAV